MQREILGMLVLMLSGSMAMAHSDVRPGGRGGRVVTDAIDDANGELMNNVRVFGYDFGEDPLDPYFVTDPGFNAPMNSGLPGSTAVGFDILAGSNAMGQGGNLKYYSGTGPIALTSPGVGMSIRLNLGSQNAVADGNDGLVAGFTLATTDVNGAMHRHLNAFLENSAGDPVEGVYVFAMQLRASGLVDSLPIYIVFNDGLSEGQHDAVMEYVQAAYVPEPGSGLLLAGVVGALCRRRR